MQFEDASDARLSNEEARRKIMQRTLTGAALCAISHAYVLCVYPSALSHVAVPRNTNHDMATLLSTIDNTQY